MISSPGGPVALVLGDLDLARPLRAAGAHVVVVGDDACPARFSRHGFGWLPDPRPDEQALVERLVDLGARSGRAPLFFQDDAALLFVSRRREALLAGTRFLLPSHELVEQLVDKEQFAALAERLGLPVPSTRVVRTADREPDVDLPFPVLAKPPTRDSSWIAYARGSKATVLADREQLRSLLEAVAPHHDRVLLQQLVPGPESRVESYHAYVDAEGRLVSDFTGRKLRTRPAVHGFSTALVTTDADDVRACGRSVVQALGLVGVAKLDFKRDRDGRLWLLEVNPRFNLWHHLGAAAGCNLPALVLADLLGLPRPAALDARPGVGWCHVPLDLLAARDGGLGMVAWSRWWRHCGRTVAGLDVTDPMPFVRGRLLPAVVSR